MITYNFKKLKKIALEFQVRQYLKNHKKTAQIKIGFLKIILFLL